MILRKAKLTERTIGDKRTVLIVDDDPDILGFVALTLELEGYAVETALNGSEGLDAVKASKPGLILLDLTMPVMDGEEFYRRLRSDGGRDVPVVIMTAAWKADEKSRQLEAQGFLGKPFDLDELISVVGQFVSPSQC